MRKLSKKATETAVDSSATSAVAPNGAHSLGVAFVAPRKALHAAVKRLAAIADKRSTLKVLANLAIQTGPHGVTLCATDLNVYGVTTIADWTVTGNGSITVNAKSLSDLLAKLPDGNVQLRAVENFGVEVSAAGATVNLTSFPARDYPKIPAVGPTDKPLPFTKIDGGALRSLIQSVESAVCQDQTRFHLNGLLIQYRDAQITMVATDGHRLHKAQRELAREGDFETPTAGVIVPERGATEIRKLLPKTGACEIAMVGSNMLAVRVGPTTIVTKLIDAQFPPHEQVIPKTNARLCTVATQGLRLAMERAKVVESSTRGSVLTMTRDTLAIVTPDGQGNELRDTLAAESRPADVHFTIGVQPKYLLDALAAIDDERVTLAFSTDDSECKGYEKDLKGNRPTQAQLSPILLRATSDATSNPISSSPLVVVVMPMRI